MLSPTTSSPWSPFPSCPAPRIATPASEAKPMLQIAPPNLGRRRRAQRSPAVILLSFSLLSVLMAALLAALSGCTRRERPLEPGDLSKDESLYVTRVLVLERVRAALLVDAARGVALGDSLTAAWGDSARSRALDLAPTDPERAALVHELLLRLLAAEQDSLLRLRGVRALDAPWPAPADSVQGANFPASARVRGDD